MAIVKRKPTSPGRRFVVSVVNPDLHKGAPHAPLIEKKSKNTTTVIVSHRISSVKNADHIIVLEDGQIIQEGTHNQLVRKNGYYKVLYKKQLQEFSS